MCLESSYTTLLTWDHSHVSFIPSSTSNISCLSIPGYAYLKEPLQPPDLKDTLPYQDSQLKYAPPFDPAICALSCIAVGPLTDNDVGLFIFDLIQQLRELFHCKSSTQ